VHKAKGMEFDLVIYLAIEEEMFWGNPDEERADFFVGISRAKRHLVLTTATTRSRPEGAARWDTARTPHQEFLSYAN
jgi:superfamily I DNA/RNA helicase